MKKLNENDMGTISGGQIELNDVMGVVGLFVCVGAPTEMNPDGVFWKRNGISLTKDEAMDILKKKSNRYLNEDEVFLESYIQKYNDQVDGYIYN